MAAIPSLHTILDGNYGLGRTFWVGLGLLSILGPNVVVLARASSTFAVVAFLLMTGLPFAWTLATWRDASLYEGREAWAWLARLVLLSTWAYAIRIFVQAVFDVE